MKKNYNFILFFKITFCLFFLIATPALHAAIRKIKIDNNLHQISIGERAASYQWYRNGEKLAGETSGVLGISKGGNYKVQVVEIAGSVEEIQVNLAVTATGAIVRIYTIGDSTVQDYTAGYYPRKGWGQVLPVFFNTANVQVINKAAGGTSSKSYYNNQWPAVRNAIAPGDYVFIQFGINDAKHTPPDTARDAATGGVFESYLKRYIDDTRAKGAYPVLVTTVRRNSWNADALTVYDAYHNYPIATRTVASDNKVPLIDLDAKLKVAMEAVGKVYTTRFWHNNYVAGEYPNYPNGNTDDVHFQEMGAINNASLVVQSIKELSADPSVSKLIPFINAQYQVAVTVNPAGSDAATTRTASYPQGLTITLKTIPKSGKTFIKWNNSNGTSISGKTLTNFTSGASSTAYAAIYSGAVITGLEEEESRQDVLAYPNPFVSDLVFRVPEYFHYFIYNISGSEVENGEGEFCIVAGAGLSTGIYMVKIQTEKETRYLRLTKL